MEAEQQILSQGRHVLIVEDEARFREMLLRVVKDMEFRAVQAPNAEAALSLLQREPFDIVLTDLNLPGLHGIELCNRIRQQWPTTQIIILTGFGDLESAKSAIRLDVVDFLTKPCSLGDLETALNRALRRRMNHIFPRPTINLETETHQDTEHDRPRTLQEVEREYVLAALARHDGNRASAAEELGVSVRTLYYRLNEYERLGISVGRKPN